MRKQWFVIYLSTFLFTICASDIIKETQAYYCQLWAQNNVVSDRITR